MNRILFSFAILALTLYICSPLLLPVAMGAVFAVLFHPVLRKLEQRRFSTGRAAAFLSIAITLVILIPAIFLIVLGAKAGIEQLRILQASPKGALSGGVDGASPFEALLQVPFFHRLTDYANNTLKVETAEILIALEDGAKSLALRIADVLGGFLTQIPAYLMGLVVMVVSVYFFLVDGHRVAAFVRRNSFFNELQTEALIHSFAGTCRSVILATVASGGAQAGLYALSVLISGRSDTVMIGLLVFLCSFVPLIGSAPVTFGVALHWLFTGHQAGGIFLIVMAVVVALVDNFIRPAILKGSGGLHPLLAFLAVFGGLQTLGFAGVFLGPIVAALAVASIQHLAKPTVAPGP